MKIVIITDGNSTLGMGHVYQSITLASIIGNEIRSDAQICFITKSDPIIVDLIKRSGFIVIQCFDDDAIFDQLCRLDPHLIIFDKLDVSPELAKMIKSDLNGKLIIFTNLTTANEYADMQVMAGMGSKFKNIRLRDERGHVSLFGPKYWLLRPEFYTYYKKPPASIKNIMLIFGGSDQANLSSLVADQLLQFDVEFNITIVIGAAFEHEDSLKKVILKNSNSKSRIEVKRDIKNVAELMYKSDLVCASPGLSFFEAICVGTPVLCFHQNEFQRKAWEGQIQTHSALDVTNLPEIICSRSFIFPDDPDIVAMEIGKGVNELLDEIFRD